MQHSSSKIYAPISAGELVDKITILSIKSVKIKDSAKLENVLTELNFLLECRDKNLKPSSELGKLTNNLQVINEKLWYIEDEVRKKEKIHDFGEEFVQLCRSVYLTNDERSAVKRNINMLYNSEVVEEKSYTNY